MYIIDLMLVLNVQMLYIGHLFAISLFSSRLELASVCAAKSSNGQVSNVTSDSAGANGINL